jgi:hypothetical protein
VYPYFKTDFVRSSCLLASSFNSSIYQQTHAFTTIHQHPHAFTSIYQHQQAFFTSIYQDLLVRLLLFNSMVALSITALGIGTFSIKTQPALQSSIYNHTQHKNLSITALKRTHSIKTRTKTVFCTIVN